MSPFPTPSHQAFFTLLLNFLFFTQLWGWDNQHFFSFFTISLLHFLQSYYSQCSNNFPGFGFLSVFSGFSVYQPFYFTFSPFFVFPFSCCLGTFSWHLELTLWMFHICRHESEDRGSFRGSFGSTYTCLLVLSVFRLFFVGPLGLHTCLLVLSVSVCLSRIIFCPCTLSCLQISYELCSCAYSGEYAGEVFFIILP